MALRFRLAEYMEEHNVTGYRLAQLTGMTPSAIYKLQKSKRLDLGTLEKVCDALGCTPADLFVYEPTKKKRGH